MVAEDDDSYDLVLFKMLLHPVFVLLAAVMFCMFCAWRYGWLFGYKMLGCS